MEFNNDLNKCRETSVKLRRRADFKICHYLGIFCSEHNEERNLLRLQAWERRNQETSPAKEQENVPLFGEPYKVKWKTKIRLRSNIDYLFQICQKTQRL